MSLPEGFTELLFELFPGDLAPSASLTRYASFNDKECTWWTDGMSTGMGIVSIGVSTRLSCEEATYASFAARSSTVHFLCHRSGNGDGGEGGRPLQGVRAQRSCGLGVRYRGEWPTERCSCRRRCRRSDGSTSSSAASRTTPL